MSKIIKLDQNLANQIAAWEVVERPVSVVKELVENSIDAWSWNIKVEIINWWKSQIIISDNWEWITKEDLEISIDKYTTSKIKTLDDLYNVMTFWFRWEALSSISSVSRFSITSKTPQNDIAYRLDFDNINWKKISTTSFSTWTQIIVSDLFFNTPARLNYLKTERTEYSKILDYLYAVSLSYPNVWFEFWSDNKKIFKFNKDEDLKTRIYNIYWNDFLDNILDINFSLNGINISWYITNPKINFPNKNRQNLFVNHRPISSPIVFKAINDAYNRFIPHSSFSWYVLNLQIDPTIIDVNVHPRKSEIRFALEQDVFRAVYHAILDKLEKSSLITPPASLPPQLRGIEGELNVKSEKYYTWSWTKFKSYSPYKDISSNPSQIKILDSINFTKNILDINEDILNENKSSDLHETKLWKIIWQTFNSYIIVENNQGLIMLDQHALAERIIYEKLVKKDKKINSQWLLIPENIKLTNWEILIIQEQKNIFLDMWFEIEKLSNWIISILAIPEFIKKENLKDVFLWIITDINSWNILKSKTLEEVKNKIYAYTACRSAIKFWNKLNLFEMNKLLNDSIHSYSRTCPHGRPVIFEISLDELKWKYER